MERTSSLDLFRGSDAFTSLTFLDGQELSHEANSGNIAAEGGQPSQAIPASMPINSVQRPSKLLHTSRLAAGFSGWPQTDSSLYPSLAMQQPATARHMFLPLGSPASQHTTGTADCQADSFAALLADDTALGFADDCFRRESDLHLSQDHAVAAETAYQIALSSNDKYTSPSEQPQDNITASTPPSAVSPATQSAASESVPHNPLVGRVAPVTVSANAAPHSPPDVASASQGIASAQNLITTSFRNPSQPPPEDGHLPAAHASITAADACANKTAADAYSSGTEPEVAHDQLQTADQPTGHMQADAPNSTQVEPPTSTDHGQAHTAQASASSCMVAALTARDAVANNLGARRSMRLKASEPLLRPPPLSAQNSSQAEAMVSPDCATAPGDAPDSCAQAPLEDNHAGTTELEAIPAQVKADLHDSAEGERQHASHDCQRQNASQVQGSVSQQQKLGSGQAAGGRPKLAVQDYQLPLLQTARDVPDSGAQTQQDKRQPEQPGPVATLSQGAHTRLPQDASTSQHRDGMPGVFYIPGLQSYVLLAEDSCCGRASSKLPAETVRVAARLILSA